MRTSSPADHATSKKPVSPVENESVAADSSGPRAEKRVVAKAKGRSRSRDDVNPVHAQRGDRGGTFGAGSLRPAEVPHRRNVAQRFANLRRTNLLQTRVMAENVAHHQNLAVDGFRGTAGWPRDFRSAVFP